MDRTSADAFVYARASGMFAQSWTGRRAKKLFSIKRLQDLWVTLFADDPPLVPEGMLALLLERRSDQRFVDNFLELLSFYDVPDAVSASLLSLYDIANLKAAVSALALGKKDPPFFISRGKGFIVDTSAWPDVRKMTHGGPLSWYTEAPAVDGIAASELMLDRAWSRHVWSAVRSLKPSDREAVEPLVIKRLVYENIVWALRLKVYYRKPDDEIAAFLAGSDADRETRDMLCKPALSMLDRPIDAWDSWTDWRYRWMLNPHEAGTPWTIDPRWVQLASDNRLYREALHCFHRVPFTPGVLVSFFMIGQLEIQMIRVAAEGIRLGADASQMNDITGVMTDA